MLRHNDTGPSRRSPLRALVLATACGWLLLMLSILVSPAVFAFGPVNTNSAPLAPTSPTSAPTATPTPTNTPGPRSTATPTITPTATPQSSPTATATTPPGGGGGGGGGDQGGGGGGPAGPNVTRVVFSQPTVGSSDSGPLQGLTPSAFGSNGLLLASTLGCVVATLGIIIAAIALLVLVRGGYGPFLKALLRGKRAGRKRDDRAEAGSASGWSSGQGPGMGYPSGASYAPRGQEYSTGFRDGYDDEYAPPPARSSSRQGYPARPSAPNPRGRQNWR